MASEFQSNYSQLEDQRGSLPPASMFASSRGPVASDNSTYERPSGINIGSLAMYFSIAVMLLLFGTGIASMVTIIGIATRVTLVAGTGVSAANVVFLANFISFCTLFMAALGITFELRIEQIISRFPVMATYWGRGGYYFFLALIVFGQAGDLGLATGSLLIFNCAIHIGLGYMARRQSSVY